MLMSLEEGLRKYQSAADAEALASLAAENGANRERFRQYLTTLAAEREKQLEVMDREAQRCRAIMMSAAAGGSARRGEEEVIAPMPFMCSICGEESTRICRRCTKDACDNHICERCLSCSDCCECEVALREPVHEPARAAIRAARRRPRPNRDLNPNQRLRRPRWSRCLRMRKSRARKGRRLSEY